METIYLKNTSNKVQYVIHVSDIHIRTGDLEKCRYSEYNDVFKEFIKMIENIENLDKYVLVMTGDIFHNKGKIEPSGIRLAHNLLIELLEHVDVIMICGNHDYRQDNPSIPDMIETIYENFINGNIRTKHRAFYLDKTAYYIYANICFTVMNIKDTLKNYNTSGKKDDILMFPPRILHLHSNLDYSIALFHGSILPSRMVNNLQLKEGYDIDWFADHEFLMLGDNHRMQWSRDNIRLWGYSGSFIQQDFGEYFMEHGYLIWNLHEKSISCHQVYNNYGFCSVKEIANNICVHTNRHQWTKLDSYERFPKYPSIRVFSKDLIKKVQEFSLANNIEPKCIIQWTSSSCVNNEPENCTDVVDLHHIEELNTTDKWFEYLEKHISCGDINEIKSYILHPELLKLPCIDDIEIMGCLKKYIQRNDKIQKCIDEYMNETTKIYKHAQSVELINMQWSYLMCYGEGNHCNFSTLKGNIALLNGKNAMGKSSFLDVICIALYGEPTIMRNIVNGKKYTDKIIHDNKPVNKVAPFVKLLFKIGEEQYEIYRAFGTQSAKNKEHLILQTAVHIYHCKNQLKELICEGSTMVDKWIDTNIGNMETVLMSSMICQTDLSNFFHLKQDDQKNILDKALRIDTVSIYGKILKESILAHNDINQQIKTAKNTVEKLIPYDCTSKKIENENAIKKIENKLIEQQSWRNIILNNTSRIIKEQEILENIDELFHHVETEYLALSSKETIASSNELAIVYREKLAHIDNKLKDIINVELIENDEKMHSKWLDKYTKFLEKKPLYDCTLEKNLEKYKIWKDTNMDYISNDLIDIEEKFKESEKKLLEFTKIEKPTFKEIQYDKPTITEEEYNNYKETYNHLMSNPIIKNRTHDEYNEWLENYNKWYNDPIKNIDIEKINKRLAIYEKKIVKYTETKKLEEAINSLKSQLNELNNLQFNAECWACKSNPYFCKKNQLITECQKLEGIYEYIKPDLLSKWENIIKECQETISQYEKYISKKQQFEFEKSYWENILKSWVQYDEWKDALDKISNYIKCYDIFKESETWKRYNEQSLNHERILTNYKKYKHLYEVSLEQHEWNMVLKEHTETYEMYKIWSEEHEVILSKLNSYKASIEKRKLEKERLEYYNEYVKKEELSTLHSNYEKYKNMYYSNKLHIVDKTLHKLNQEREGLIIEKANIDASIALFQKHKVSADKLDILDKMYEERIARIKELDVLFIGDKQNSDGYKEWIYKTQVIPLINNEMNEFLKMFEHFKFEMSYDKKHFIYMLDDRGNKPTLDKASGYQNFITGLAFRIILSRIGAVGQQLKHLFIDEGFTACDSVNIEKIPLLLKSVLKYCDYTSIIMMSHLDSVRECTNIYIDIERTDPFSYIRFSETYPLFNTIIKTPKGDIEMLERTRGRPSSKSKA